MYTLQNAPYQGAAIATLIDDDEGTIWFDAQHICNTLDFSQMDIVLALEAADRKSIHIAPIRGWKTAWKEAQERVFVSEPGVYDLTLMSTRIEAKEFRRYLTHTILPSLRKFAQEKQKIQEVLTALVSPILFQWHKTFPNDFFLEVYRLRGWIWTGERTAMPSWVGWFIAREVYAPICPGLLPLLQEKNPYRENSIQRKNKHHQWLTQEIGKSQLECRIAIVKTLMRVSCNYADYRQKARLALPKQGTAAGALLQTETCYKKIITGQMIFDFEKGESV